MEQRKSAKYTVNSLTHSLVKYIYLISYLSMEMYTGCDSTRIQNTGKISQSLLWKTYIKYLWCKLPIRMIGSLEPRTGSLDALVTCVGGTNSNSEADSEFRALFPPLSSGWDLCSEVLEEPDEWRELMNTRNNIS